MWSVPMASIIFTPSWWEICLLLSPVRPRSREAKDSSQVKLMGREAVRLGLLDLRWVCLALGPATFWGSIRSATHKEGWRNSKITPRHDPWQYHCTPEDTQVPSLSLCRQHFIGYTKGVRPTSRQFSNAALTWLYLIAARPHQWQWATP